MQEQSKEPLPRKTTPSQRRPQTEGRRVGFVTVGAVVAEMLRDGGNQAHNPRVPAGPRVQLSIPPLPAPGVPARDVGPAHRLSWPACAALSVCVVFPTNSAVFSPLIL